MGKKALKKKTPQIQAPKMQNQPDTLLQKGQNSKSDEPEKNSETEYRGISDKEEVRREGYDEEKSNQDQLESGLDEPEQLILLAVPESPNTADKRRRFVEKDSLTPPFLPVPCDDAENEISMNIGKSKDSRQEASESKPNHLQTQDSGSKHKHEDFSTFEDPINDLSSSLRIITYTFTLLLVLTLLSNLYYLTFLNSFSRSLGMIHGQYNISF